MQHSNGFPAPTKVEEPLGTYATVYEANRDWTNSYNSVIGVMLYLASRTRPDIPFAVHKCAWFTHNTNASYKTAVERICRYLKCTKDNGLVCNPSKKLVVYCYADADVLGLWGHENPQYPIFARSRTGFVVTFANCPLLWVSKLQIDIDLSPLHYEYVALSHSGRALLPLKSISKEVIDNLGVYGEKLKFVSSSTIYEDNNGAIVVATSPRMNPTFKNIAVKYHWFRQQVGEDFLIRKIESENRKADIFTKGLQGVIFLRMRKFLYGC